MTDRPPSQHIPVVWRVDVVVLPKIGVNDPQGEAILNGLTMLGYKGAARVRAGKLIQVWLTAVDVDDARRTAEAMADQLLANPTIESFRIGSVEPETEAVGGEA